ncbi:hypothetical protein HCH_03330 [Hahella chejuensis KCTC 2396]|uniref:Uncharacterized protein n=1 Tax=Hahella chejuensis (strain KCTC 2396) TaxID=349521 RepID=Q2SGZ0_HAHCH|nr:hypothetical protein [Hahella chejuensis]ABC30084.1 hypothetical protein HCH_03330 [Hahella chejuensis KCTC 2396]
MISTRYYKIKHMFDVTVDELPYIESPFVAASILERCLSIEPEMDKVSKHLAGNHFGSPLNAFPGRGVSSFPPWRHKFLNDVKNGHVLLIFTDQKKPFMPIVEETPDGLAPTNADYRVGSWLIRTADPAPPPPPAVTGKVSEVSSFNGNLGWESVPQERRPLPPIKPGQNSEQTSEEGASDNATAKLYTEQEVNEIVNDPEKRKELFDKHGITVGPYRTLQGVKLTGYQREHFVPHSCFMARSRNAASKEKRSAVPIRPEFGSYTEGNAITYFVYDGQSNGTEHRYLTDEEAKFAKDLQDEGRYATVTEWLDHMEYVTAMSLPMTNIMRAKDEYRARVPADDAALVAKCIRKEYELYLESCGCDMDALCSNLIGGGDVPAGNIRTGEDF